MSDNKALIQTALQKTVTDGEQAKQLLRLISLPDDQQLSVTLKVLDSLIGFSQDYKSPDGKDNQLQTAGVIAELIERITSGTMTSDALLAHLNMHRNQVSAAKNYLPHPFSQSQQVMGALILMVRARALGRQRHDLPTGTIYWEQRLGKLEKDWNLNSFVKDNRLMPLAFSSNVNLTDTRLNQQFFGYVPALRSQRHHKNGDALSILHDACAKWPLTDFYAFAPLPSTLLSETNEHLLMKKLNWPEQQQQLEHLCRKYPETNVRFATLPELMFIDLSLRLTDVVSPMSIMSFRCAHPSDNSKCLTYGHVDDYGAEITDNSDPTRDYLSVLPLFCPRIKK